MERRFELDLELGGKNIPLDIRKRFGVRNISVSIAPRSPVRVTAPFFVSDSRIFAFLYSKQNWILEKFEHYSSLPTPSAFLERTYFLGQEYKIVHLNKQGRSEIRISGGEMHVFTNGISGKELRMAIVRFFKAHARKMILHSLREWNKDGRFKFRRIFLKGQRTVWGSCSHRGNLNFNWKLVMAPREILHYIVLHELMHLEEMNHSKRYWAKVRELCPEYKQYERYLKKNGEKFVL
ncbi:MAG TPA: M48 family metallopeptidase [Nanoarchaeota archaeon]|nr:MAG: hypothetical protein QT01_C0003G0038 [archaeon GW2011_AR6]MBS3082967.1 M48 family metallopeptidase [Candidatus Pacearchaeota archaeon]HIH17338.1 M48 family metallopeptidase [Nanoarchaeota archaeon]HIH34784.1 M48 family metallopeptidase [Nanoarchaeota archaeon]HIH51216.1 M48 family metallopeptidase [Nanoarchaeota archaeon]